MKKIVILVFALVLSQSVFSYTWNKISPAGIVPDNLILLESADGFYGAVATVDSGMFFSESIWNPLWTFYPFRVKDACPFDANNILVLINEGSYSDGVYSFNLTSGELSLVSFIFKPNFIKRTTVGEDRFLIGYEGGLMASDDGVSWTAMPFFEGKNCIKATQGTWSYDSNIALITAGGVSGVYYSEDFGDNWVTVNGGFMTDLNFDANGNLFGLDGHEGSFSQGYYKCNGTYWEAILYMDMDVLGCDNLGVPFFGWSSGSQIEGVARYNNGELLFFNEGLENLNVRYITSLRFVIGGGGIFVGTDSGTYYCSDYTTGIDVHRAGGLPLEAYPNPTRDLITIEIPNTIHPKEMSIYSSTGLLIENLKMSIGKEKLNVDMKGWKSGIYLLKVSDGQTQWVKKIVRL